MALMAGITTSVHFVVLTVGHSIAASGSAWGTFLFSFQWPSVVYALDILAWDGFFALAMLFAAPVFKGGNLKNTVGRLMLISGILSLAGFAGIPLENMQVRNIGIIGYAGIAPVIFFLIGRIFDQKNQADST
jgi:hypothetical protein